MTFADLALSRRLERAEGAACTRFAEARRRIKPESGAQWIECAGALASFDGIGSPLTQSFGLGLFEPLTENTLDEIEQFFFSHGSAAIHEVSPFAGDAALDLLCKRNYFPIEISNVLFQLIERRSDAAVNSATARPIEPNEAQLWADISAKGWASDHPELSEFLKQFNAVAASKDQTVYFIGELDGKPGAAGALNLHEGVALFGGSATIPELRRRGLQNALLHERLRYALDQECDLAMMVAHPGSNSQRNAERQGFRIAYTRIKWQKNP